MTSFSSLELENDEANEFIRDMLGFLERVEARDDGSYSPQPFVTDRLQGFVAGFETKQERLKKLVIALNSLLDSTRGFAPSHPLDVVLEKSRKEQAAKLADQLVVSGKAGRDKANADLADATKAAQENLAASEIKLKNANAESESLKNDTAADNILADSNDQKVANRIEAAKRMLEQEFQRDLADIQRYLCPFLGAGAKHRGPNKGIGPVSFGLIESCGALNENTKGLVSLGFAANETGRDLGGFPVSHSIDRIQAGFNNTEATVRYLSRAQELLKKYGALMVEKEMLGK